MGEYRSALLGLREGKKWGKRVMLIGDCEILAMNKGGEGMDPELRRIREEIEREAEG
jgi:hypothetical protein